MAFVSESGQYEVSNHQAVYHEGDDIPAFVNDTVNRIVIEFGVETAYRVINVKHRRDGSERTMVGKAGLEPFVDSLVIENLRKHIYEMVKKNYAPVIFEIRLFISYDEPKL